METSRYIVLQQKQSKMFYSMQMCKTISRDADFDELRERIHPGFGDLEVSEKTLSAEDARNLSHAGSIYQIAKAIPMRLLRPMSKRRATTAVAPWGIDAIGAGRSDFTGKGVVVAVLDTGINSIHPAFEGVELVQKNFTPDDEAEDEDGHGTHCAGTIFGRDVDKRRIGVARGVTKALIGKVIGRDGGDSAQIVRAIQWAVDEGAHVISMSLGFDSPGYFDRLVKAGYTRQAAFDTATQDMLATKELFDTVGRTVVATRSDVVLVVAAGNESTRPKYTITASAPAGGGAEFVTVGAIGPGTPYSIAAFSNTGVDVVAPGVDIVSAALGDGYEAMDGTSMATPHVAGIAALMLEQARAQNPNVKARLIRDRIRGGATIDPLPPDSNPDDVGNGVAQAP